MQVGRAPRNGGIYSFNGVPRMLRGGAQGPRFHVTTRSPTVGSRMSLSARPLPAPGCGWAEPRRPAPFAHRSAQDGGSQRGVREPRSGSAPPRRQPRGAALRQTREGRTGAGLGRGARGERGAGGWGGREVGAAIFLPGRGQDGGSQGRGGGAGHNGAVMGGSEGYRLWGAHGLGGGSY